MLRIVGIICAVFCLISRVFAQNVEVTLENDVRLRFESSRQYEDSDSTTNDSGFNGNSSALELYPSLNFNFGEGFKIKSSWVFEVLKDSGSSNNFQGEGLALDELYASYENDDAEFFIGKINPNFAYLWNRDISDVIWTSDIAETYKITGKIGLGGKIKMDLDEHGKHDIALTTFYYDDSKLSDTAISRRTISGNNIGLASDTGSLSSFTVDISSHDLRVLDGMFYDVSYRFLKNPNSLNIDDEKGYSLSLGVKKVLLNNLLFQPMIEYVKIDNFNSFNNDFNQGFGDDDYMPADLESIVFEASFKYSSWSLGYMYSDRQYDKLLESGSVGLREQGFSIGYRFANDIVLKVGTKKSERDDISMSQSITSLELLYKYYF